MRILKLRFMNLNSLAGEWEIDFTHPAFSSEGIFAIAGPTGAGKTTILDALCLALYGQTPRLGKVTKGGNDIMARHTGECFAEVSFETPGGCYRCHWAQHRARGKPGGELQSRRHEIAEADSGKILESNIRGVAERIEGVTGMDFERFTRSMLLAQGEFAAFLQAGADERSPILEQITGTEIYSRISVRVHERRREEKRALELLEDSVQGIEVLGSDEKAEMIEALGVKQGEEKELSECSEGTRKALEGLVRIEGLKREIADLAAESGRLDAEAEAFAPRRERLKAAMSAASLEGGYQRLRAARIRRREDGEALEGLGAAFPELEAAAAAAEESLQAARNRTQAARKQQESAAPLIQKVRALDDRLEDTGKTIAEERESCREHGARIDKKRQEGHLEREKHAGTRERLEAVRGDLDAHGDDEWLIEGLGGVKEQLSGLLTLRDELGRGEKAHREASGALERARASLESARRQIGIRRRELSEAAGRLEQGREHLAALLAGRLLREYRSDKDHLHEKQIHLNRIADLEQHRRYLEEGHPCPLCGALHHPFVEDSPAPGAEDELDKIDKTSEIDKTGGIDGIDKISKINKTTEIDEIDQIEKASELEKIKKIDEISENDQKIATLGRLIAEAETREATVRELEAAEIRARGGLSEAEAAESAAVSTLNTAAESLAGASDNLKRHRAALENRRRALSQTLPPGLLHTLKAPLEGPGPLKAPFKDSLEDQFEDPLKAPLKGPFEAPLDNPLEDPLGKNIPALIENLEARRERQRRRISEKTELEGRLDSLAAHITSIDAVITALEGALADRSSRLKTMERRFSELTEERRALFGGKNPGDEECRLGDAASRAETRETQAREKRDRHLRERDAAKDRIAELSAGIARREPELITLENDFAAALAPGGFGDEQKFLEARLPEERRAELEAQARQLDNRRTRLNTAADDRRARLTAEQAENPGEESPETLRRRLDEHEESLKELREIIAELRHRLRRNADAEKRLREKRSAIEGQKNEYRKWDRLHGLIGSADGGKYRGFAQGITFETMVGRANLQLQKMTDRYLLIRDENEPLMLNVIDNYQAGEIRSTRNLSGGESFIVSLALALGLSRMASRNVRIDSLFLDEGFGTLDEDALDTALETLGSLRQEGKLIGVISHVAALKQRIGTQIEVTPLSGGRSRISGPGCRRAE